MLTTEEVFGIVIKHFTRAPLRKRRADLKCGYHKGSEAEDFEIDREVRKKFLTKQERCGNISKLPKGGGRTALRMREQKSLKKLEKSS